MGYYLNPSNKGFLRSLRSEIYVDKSGIISYTNKVLDTNQKYVCVSRPRRFGKTITAEMLAAYYSRSCDSYNMFQNLKIANDPGFNDHLNKYNVIFVNMQMFLSGSHNIDKMIVDIFESIVEDILKVQPGLYQYTSKGRCADAMQALYEASDTPIVFIIDEWDCIFREFTTDKASQRIYLDFLRNLLKDRDYVALAYMTGILPIKKYGTHSALNMFDEFSMTDPGPLAEYVGFTCNEVQELCDRYKTDYEEMAEWYDGYRFPDTENVYNPKSAVSALLFKRFSNYWSRTETYEALGIYIKMNFDGLKDVIVKLLAGEENDLDITSFTNDMVTFESYEDVLTLLVHLGYLGYCLETHKVFIPNREIANEFMTAVRAAGWNEITAALKASDDLLKSTWLEDAESVARAIEKAHNEISILKYNDENSLACVISLAYYNARQYYSIIREMPAGKGFADLVFLPKKNHMDKPAMIIELKWDKSAAGAIKQIESRQYPEAIKDYRENALLIGINYNIDLKRHECVIKRL